ncbi:MAG: hypothetical protein HRF45_07975 [Fimbriimonadia bacterium]
MWERADCGGMLRQAQHDDWNDTAWRLERLSMKIGTTRHDDPRGVRADHGTVARFWSERSDNRRGDCVVGVNK